MSNIDKINVNGTTYDIQDTVSGYMTDVQVNGTSIVSSGIANLVTNTAYNATSNKIATMSDLGAAGGGTVTSVAVSNATNGGLTVSGSPITSSGTITVGHSNVLTNAQTTQAVYPIAIDKNGHISSYGSATTIPTATSDLTNDSGYITGISSSDVTTALGYTPYNSTNPSGYTTNTGTVTSVRVQATSPIVSSVNTAQTGTLDTTISHSDSGVTAGTYNSVTVDAKGHVTAGSNEIETLKVTLTYNDGTSSFEADKTYSAIKSAYDAGAFVYAVIYNDSTDNKVCPLTSTNYNQDGNYVVFEDIYNNRLRSWALYDDESIMYSYTEFSLSSHTHGNITSGGDITTNVTIASGDRLVINDESASKINSSSITFGSSTTSFLANNGTWQTPATGGTGTVTSVDSGTGLTGGPITTSGTLSLATSGVTAGTYQGITVDQYGRVTSASDQGYTTNTGTITGISTSSPLSGSGTSGSVTISHANSGVSAKTTQAVYPFTVNATGHITGVGSAQTIPKITVSSSQPTGVNSGDLWIKI